MGEPGWVLSPVASDEAVNERGRDRPARAQRQARADEPASVPCEGHDEVAHGASHGIPLARVSRPARGGTTHGGNRPRRQVLLSYHGAPTCQRPADAVPG